MCPIGKLQGLVNVLKLQITGFSLAFLVTKLTQNVIFVLCEKHTLQDNELLCAVFYLSTKTPQKLRFS